MVDFNELSTQSLLDYQIKEQSCNKNKEIHNHQGLTKSSIWVMSRIKRFIFMTNNAIWFEKDLTGELTDYQPKNPVEIDITSTSQTIKWLKSQKQSWVVHPKEIATALKYNHCWSSVRKDDKIIGAIKIGFGNVYIVDYNRVIKFPEGMAFIYDTYVLQEERGKGVAKYLITESIKFLKTQGYTRVRCHIPPWNKASINAYEKVGFRKVSHIRYFRIFGIPIRKVKFVKEKSNVKGR